MRFNLFIPLKLVNSLKSSAIVIISSKAAVCIDSPLPSGIHCPEWEHVQNRVKLLCQGDRHFQTHQVGHLYLYSHPVQIKCMTFLHLKNFH